VIADPKAWMWFFSSYAPLWIMLGLRFSNTPVRITLIAFGVACFSYVAFIISRSARERPSNTELTIAGDAGADVSGYLASYLLPFLTVPEPSLTDVLAYVIFVLVAGLVYVRSGLMQINPTAYLLGRRVCCARARQGAGPRRRCLSSRAATCGSRARCKLSGSPTAYSSTTEHQPDGSEVPFHAHGRAARSRHVARSG
jgi:hypothetical protein